MVQAKLTAAIIMLLFIALIALPTFAERDEQETMFYYQLPNSIIRKATIRTTPPPLPSAVGMLTPRQFADYLWDSSPNDAVTNGWAQTSDIPAGGVVAYPPYHGTPLGVYRAIFSNTSRAARLTEQYRWGISMSCPSSAYAKYCIGTMNGGTGVLPAGLYWTFQNLAQQFIALALSGYTQAEIMQAGLDAGYDAKFVTKSLLFANSNEQTYYPSIQVGDVDPAIYGQDPFVMKVDVPVWGLINTGAPTGPLTTNNKPPNAFFGTLVYGTPTSDMLNYCAISEQASIECGQGDVFTKCALPNEASAACWRGERPNYLIIPSDIVTQVGKDKLIFIDSTTRRLIAGGYIVRDINAWLNGYKGESGDTNICYSVDAGCITLKMYQTYYDDVVILGKALTAWEQQHKMQIIWSGVSLESTIPLWISMSQMPNPVSATLTYLFHNPLAMTSPQTISPTVQEQPAQLQPSSDIYARILFQWLPQYTFIRDFAFACVGVEDCEGQGVLKSIRLFIATNQKVASTKDVDDAMMKGENAAKNLDQLDLSRNVALNLGSRISYLWNGCNNQCVKSFGQLDTKSRADLTRILQSSLDQFTQTIMNNGNYQILGSKFFNNAISPLVSSLLTLNSNQWELLKSTVQSCTSLGQCQILITLPNLQPTPTTPTPPKQPPPKQNLSVAEQTHNTTVTTMTTITIMIPTNSTSNSSRLAPDPPRYSAAISDQQGYLTGPWAPIIVVALICAITYELISARRRRKREINPYTQRPIRRVRSIRLRRSQLDTSSQTISVQDIFRTTDSLKEKLRSKNGQQKLSEY
jgi:hypothetical protein